MGIENQEFPAHLDSRGRLIIAEKHTVEYPLYLLELERFWVQYRNRLTLWDFQLAFTGIPQVRGVYAAKSCDQVDLHVVEFFYSWGTVFVCFACEPSAVRQVRLYHDGVETYNEHESRKAIWKFFDQLDAVFHASK